MKPYLANANDRDGRRDTIAREAASIEHARLVFEREGYSDIEFVDDELLATARMQRPEELQPRTPAEFRFEARLHRGTDTLVVVREALRRHRWPLLALIGLIVCGMVLRHDALIWGGGLGIVGLCVAFAVLRRPALTYDALLRASALGEVRRADALADRMQSFALIGNHEQLRQDLAFRKAMLLARQGRIDEALARVEPLAAHPQLANGVFENRVSSIHYAADHIAEFVEWQRRAHEAAPQDPTLALDYAFTLARHGDLARSRELLAGLDPRNLIPLHKAVFSAARGIGALRSGDTAAAKQELGRALQILAPFHASLPLWPFHGIIAGYAALAASRDCDVEQARRWLAPWRRVALHCLDAATSRQLAAEVPA